MPAQQLHLFAAPRPLEQRLGKQFFSRVPRNPGIYIMSDASERVLYIGQSKNLRARLNSYKNARLDRAPRKVVRLVNQVDRVVWERCESELAARQRESELLLLHRPRFNRIGTYPQPQWHIVARADHLGLEFHRVQSPVADAQCFGPLKHGPTLHAAIVRGLWATFRDPSSLAQLPAGFFGWRMPPCQRVPWGSLCGSRREERLAEVFGFLQGEDSAFVTRFKAVLVSDAPRAPYLESLLLNDVEWLERWFNSLP